MKDITARTNIKWALKMLVEGDKKAQKWHEKILWIKQNKKLIDKELREGIKLMVYDALEKAFDEVDIGNNSITLDLVPLGHPKDTSNMLEYAFKELRKYKPELMAKLPSKFITEDLLNKHICSILEEEDFDTDDRFPWRWTITWTDVVPSFPADFDWVKLYDCFQLLLYHANQLNNEEIEFAEEGNDFFQFKKYHEEKYTEYEKLFKQLSGFDVDYSVEELGNIPRYASPFDADEDDEEDEKEKDVGVEDFVYDLLRAYNSEISTWLGKVVEEKNFGKEPTKKLKLNKPEGSFFQSAK